MLEFYAGKHRTVEDQPSDQVSRFMKTIVKDVVWVIGGVILVGLIFILALGGCVVLVWWVLKSSTSEAQIRYASAVAIVLMLCVLVPSFIVKRRSR